jgi:hypothetical protein
MPSEEREADEIELLRLLEEEYEFRRTNGLYYYAPDGKQQEFIEASADYPERCFMAGNQLGKTLAGGPEITFHLTGRYGAC